MIYYNILHLNKFILTFIFNKHFLHLPLNISN